MIKRTIRNIFQMSSQILTYLGTHLKYIVYVNILSTLSGTVCDTLKMKMRQKSTKRQAEDNLTKLYKNFYSPDANEIE